VLTCNGEDKEDGSWSWKTKVNLKVEATAN